MADIRLAPVAGERYQARVPDTLDLAERARLAVSGLTGTTDPEHGYEAYHCANLMSRPARMTHVGDQDCEPKILQALPLLRMASGSEQNLYAQERMLGRLLNDMEDGIWWMKPQGRPWIQRPLGEDVADVTGNARLMQALMAQHRVDGNPQWLEIAQDMVAGLARMAVYEDDYAYYPGQRYYRDGWRKQDGKLHRPETMDGYPQGNVLRALSYWCALTGDSKALEFAEELVQPLLIPSRWTPLDEPWMISAPEHGHWAGHFHSVMVVGWALLEYARMVHDASLLRFARDFYEYSRNLGLSRIGYFPGVVEHKRLTPDPNDWEYRASQAPFAVGMEGCGLGEMTCIAIELSDAGVGDYWDDVDGYVRNHLTELQLLRRDLLEELSQAGPAFAITPDTMTDDRVIERCLGTFAGGAELTAIYPLWTMCCVGNLAVGLAAAWEAIVRYHEGAAQVNLLLNRASPWLDIDSYLPYEGKVVIRNKTARRIHMRLPMGVDKGAVRCRVQTADVPLVWLGNYLLIDGLSTGDQVTIEFPLVETIEYHTEATYGIRHTLRMRGNTVVDISPRAGTPSFTSMMQDDGLRTEVKKAYPIYLREQYRKGRAPMVETTRFVAAQRV